MQKSKKLSQCMVNETVRIISVTLPEIERRRLELMGFTTGQKITVMNKSKETFLIVFGGKMLALGVQICDGVLVD